jgi:hypothetical protein
MATYFFRLGRFYEWPTPHWPAEGEALVACLIGRDPFRDALDFFEGKTVKGRRFTLRRLTAIQESGDCHILYVGGESRAEIRSHLWHVRDRSVLTVGAGADFARLGGNVGLVVEGSRVQLTLNTDAARRSGFLVSSKLLEVSSVVGDLEP